MTFCDTTARTWSETLTSGHQDDATVCTDKREVWNIHIDSNIHIKSTPDLVNKMFWLNSRSNKLRAINNHSEQVKNFTLWYNMGNLYTATVHFSLALQNIRKYTQYNFHLFYPHCKGLQWNCSGTTVKWLWSSLNCSSPLYALFGCTELKVNKWSYCSQLNAFTFTVTWM